MITKRKKLTTELRAAIWEAHRKRCPYTGDLIAFADLEIDHVIPVTIRPEEFSRLVHEQIVGEDFDLNGLGNLLPTKHFQNNRKSADIRGNGVLIHFLNIAENHRAAVEKNLSSSIEDEKLLTAYLKLKSKAERNSLDIEDIVDIQRQQEGLTRLRQSPELDGCEDVNLLNSELARELMAKPFALGGGVINQVILQNDSGVQTACHNCFEFLSAQKLGLWPMTQFDINCYGMADRNCGMLSALRHAKFAPRSALRYPRVTCSNLDSWSSEWVRKCWIEFEQPEDRELFERCETIADLVAQQACRIVQLEKWHVAIEPRRGLSLSISELFRADLDGDGEEEILVFDLMYAPHGTLRAGSVCVAKPDENGILRPV